MSNCIQFDNPVVCFTSEELDKVKLKELLDRVKNLDKAPDGKEDAQGYLAWWFLTSTWGAGNVRMGEGIQTTIHFGSNCRSTHTWRDFRHTILLCIEPFMLKERHYEFRIRDEMDDFEDYEFYKVEFGGYEEQLKREKEEREAKKS